MHLDLCVCITLKSRFMQYVKKQICVVKVTVYINKHSLNLSDYIRNIRDPEKPATLEDLNVVCEDGVMVSDGIFVL
jgi:hypothetical protein